MSFWVYFSSFYFFHSAFSPKASDYPPKKIFYTDLIHLKIQIKTTLPPYFIHSCIFHGFKILEFKEFGRFHVGGVFGQHQFHKS